MVLILSRQQLELIYQHGQQTYPEECCGIILGHIDWEQPIITKTCVEIISTENVWNAENAANFGEGEENSRHTRYAIAPTVMLQTQKTARDRNLEIIGIYHSHPDYPATPSEFDRSYAWPAYSYVIVSVKQGHPDSIYSWCLDEQHQFQPESMQIAPINPSGVYNSTLK